MRQIPARVAVEGAARVGETVASVVDGLVRDGVMEGGGDGVARRVWPESDDGEKVEIEMAVVELVTALAEGAGMVKLVG